STGTYAVEGPGLGVVASFCSTASRINPSTSVPDANACSRSFASVSREKVSLRVIINTGPLYRVSQRACNNRLSLAIFAMQPAPAIQLDQVHGTPGAPRSGSIFLRALRAGFPALLDGVKHRPRRLGFVAADEKGL